MNEAEARELLARLPAEEKEMLLRLPPNEAKLILQIHRYFPGAVRVEDDPSPEDRKPEQLTELPGDTWEDIFR